MVELMTANEDLADLPEPAKKLYRFVGTWHVSGTFRRNGRASHIEGSFDVAPAAGGFGLLAEMHADVEGLGRYEELDVLGYDPGCDEYHIFSVTNGAVVHDHRAEFTSEDRAEFSYRGLREHERFREEGFVQFRGDDEFSLSTINRVSDQVVFEINTVLRRT